MPTCSQWRSIEETDYQLSAELVESHWRDNTRVVLIASPSNPTGTLMPQHQLSAIYQLVREKGAAWLSMRFIMAWSTISRKPAP